MLFHNNEQITGEKRLVFRNVEQGGEAAKQKIRFRDPDAIAKDMATQKAEIEKITAKLQNAPEDDVPFLRDLRALRSEKLRYYEIERRVALLPEGEERRLLDKESTKQYASYGFSQEQFLNKYSDRVAKIRKVKREELAAAEAADKATGLEEAEARLDALPSTPKVYKGGEVPHETFLRFIEDGVNIDDVDMVTLKPGDTAWVLAKNSLREYWGGEFVTGDNIREAVSRLYKWNGTKRLIAGKRFAVPNGHDLFSKLPLSMDYDNEEETPNEEFPNS